MGGKILEKSGNFVSPEKWEPWICLKVSANKRSNSGYSVN